MTHVALYRHPKMTDVALQILSKENLGTDRQEVCVLWWNVGSCHDSVDGRTVLLLGG